MEIRFNASDMDKDIKAMIEKLKKVDKELCDEAARDIIDKCTDKLKRESVDRTPIDEGFLVASQKSEVVTEKGVVTGHVFIPANSPASDYALPIHEGHYNLGAKSLQKQAASKVVVGRKFLERALYDNMTAFLTYMQKRLKEYLK